MNTERIEQKAVDAMQSAIVYAQVAGTFAGLALLVFLAGRWSAASHPVTILMTLGLAAVMGNLFHNSLRELREWRKERKEARP